jgi:GTP cyclohydrolase I
MENVMTQCTCNETSLTIAKRLKDKGVRFFCNDNISEHLLPGESEQLLAEVAENMKKVLESLVIDTENDHNTNDTANRVAKMFMKEIFGGRYEAIPKITAFPNVTNYDQIYVTGPITIRSTCAHHMMPIIGKAYIGVYPGKNVIGLSKFNRLADWVASRPQIQEEMTQQLADIIEQETEAEGIAVVIQAEHFCMTHRGVKEHESDMTTAIMRGAFRTDKSLKKEFYDIVARMK